MISLRDDLRKSLRLLLRLAVTASCIIDDISFFWFSVNASIVINRIQMYACLTECLGFLGAKV